MTLIPEQRWTFSNALSASRFVLTIPLCWSLYHAEVGWILFWTIVACATDFLDGYLARLLRQVSDFGKVLDPLADKFMVAAGAITIYASGRIEWWVLATIVLRDLLILLGGIFVQRRYGIVMMSNQVGKWAVGFVSLSLMLCAMAIEPHWIWLSLAMSSLIISFVVYLFVFIRTVSKAS